MELGDSIMNYKPSWNWLDVILVYGGIIILSFLMGRYGQHLMSFLHQFGFPNVGLALIAVSMVYGIDFILEGNALPHLGTLLEELQPLADRFQDFF
jgi:hypothetical protein